MKKLITLLLLSAFFFEAQAQFGISAAYLKAKPSDWESLMTASDAYDFGTDFNVAGTYQIGVDYMFKLKQKRIEFYPTLAFAQLKTEKTRTGLSDMQSKFQSNLIDFSVHTNFYPLDFAGDCDCPKWSKSEPIFKKGFFIQISPGLLYGQQSISAPFSNTLSEENGSIAPQIGLGLGLDVPIGKLMVITPFVRIKRAFGLHWEDLNGQVSSETASEDLNKTALNQVAAGVRFGFAAQK